MAARRSRKKGAEPQSQGLAPDEVVAGQPPEALASLEDRIRASGGHVVGHYRDPWGASWLVLAALPLPRVAPTPFQRDLSRTHVARLEDRIRAVGIFLDPVIAVPAPESAEPVRFWTPNGFHRLNALERLGARTVTALVSPDATLAYRILALNTEKAHNVRERALEALRMARSLAELDPRRPESEYALELEEGALVTLGFAYEERPRFAGGAWSPALRASDRWVEAPLAAALETRRAQAGRILVLDDRVTELVEQLRARGLESPYLRNFVVARLRPFRRRGQEAPPVDALLDHMEKAAARFDASRVQPGQVTRAAGAPDDP